MKNRTNERAEYRLVARMRGNELTVSASLHDDLRAELRRRIRETARRTDERDTAALDECIAWERLGEFSLLSEEPSEAAEAFRQAIRSALAGCRHASERRPRTAQRLRRKYRDLAERLAVLGDHEAWLQALLHEERLLRRPKAADRKQTATAGQKQAAPVDRKQPGPAGRKP